MSAIDDMPISLSGRELFEQLVASGQMDGFFEAIDAGQVVLDGPNGFSRTGESRP